MVQRNAACPHARARAAQLSRGDRLAKPLTKNPASGDVAGWTHPLGREESSRSAPLRASKIPPLSVHIHSAGPSRDRCRNGVYPTRTGGCVTNGRLRCGVLVGGRRPLALLHVPPPRTKDDDVLLAHSRCWLARRGARLQHLPALHGRSRAPEREHVLLDE